MKKQIRIMADDTEQSLDLTIEYDQEDKYGAERMTVRTHYQRQDIVAVGTAYPFEDAFAELQKKLPKSIQLVCCVACRHGNMCPVGNGPDEVYCTKDVQITRKSDLYKYTEEPDEVRKRLRQYGDCCDDFRPQEETFYTYNDYYFYLNK